MYKEYYEVNVLEQFHDALLYNFRHTATGQYAPCEQCRNIHLLLALVS